MTQLKTQRINEVIELSALEVAINKTEQQSKCPEGYVEYSRHFDEPYEIRVNQDYIKGHDDERPFKIEDVKVKDIIFRTIPQFVCQQAEGCYGVASVSLRCHSVYVKE